MVLQIPSIVHKINSPGDIDPRDVHEGVLGVLGLPAGHTRDVMLGSVLTGLLLRGPKIAEVEAAVRAATCLDRDGWEYCLPPVGVRLVGYTGSGKKTFKTFNLSSAAAFVAATGGAHIAKLGSRSASSKTGSRDFMELVGAACDAVPHDEMVGIAAECGFGFFSIEHRVPKFDSRYGGRFHAVHALSLAFPALLSPVVCSSYVYGLSHPAVDVSAQLLSRLGLADVTVINSSTDAAMHVDELLPGATVRTSRIRDGRADPSLCRDVSLAAAAMSGDLCSIAQRPDPHLNVAAAVSVLAGHGSSAARNAVALNAALLMVAGRAAPNLQAGLASAQSIMRTDAALGTLRRFVRLTGGSPHTVEALLPTPRHVGTSARMSRTAEISC
ncbi:hypothetical protein [Streptomyces sp. A5-4]|uniref:hypothetical protein n=1 Tax=Streptomyces sp. A5-4 TaxID=3384771 RepID=UPI003DA842FE